MNTANRVLWIVVGLLLAAAGTVGTLASLGRLPWLPSDRVLLGADAARRWTGWGGKATAVTIAAALVVALLGFLLLRAQIRGRGGAPMPDVERARPVTEGEDAPFVPGRTRIASSALHHALARDLQAGGNVARAAVRLVGDAANPEVLVRLAVSPDADLGRLRSHVDGALGRFAVTSGIRPRLHDVVVTMAEQAPARVH